MKSIALSLAAFAFLYACGTSEAPMTPASGSGDQRPAGSSTEVAAIAPEASATPAAQPGQPRTVRDYFELLPEKYFTLEGCERSTDKDCKKARAEYLKSYLEVDDAKNGFLKAGCDGAQMCITMALFRRPDGRHIVAVNTTQEIDNDFYFLDHADGKWNDISADVIPGYDKMHIYELPRVGTTVPVFAKKVIERGEDYVVTEKGQKLYDLVWKDGKFTRK